MSIKIIIEQEDGTQQVIGDLDNIWISMNRPADITRKLDGSIKKLVPGKFTVTTIVATHTRKD